MPDPTLADVLVARDEMKTCRPDTAEPFCRFVDLALRYFDANRTALERMALEQSSRKFAGASAETPVIVRPGAIHPRLFVMGETLAVNDDVVLVGANWKPEVGR